MKILIVGGVAGGASAATRLRRLDESAEIILFEKGSYVSYANCGLPYFIGGVIKNKENLVVTKPELLKNRFRIDVRTEQEVVEINVKEKKVAVKDLKTGRDYTESYDKLILSPGAEPRKPDIEGIAQKGIFTLRTVPDTYRIDNFIKENSPGSALIVGGGFIGIEMAENLRQRGMKVTVVEFAPQIIGTLDPEMAFPIQEHLKEKGIELILGAGVEKFEQRGSIAVSLTNGMVRKADLIILSMGVTPESRMAKKAGIRTGQRGGIVVDDRYETSAPDIFAVGDAIEVKHLISGDSTMIPLAGPANKQGRRVAETIAGHNGKKASLVQGSSVLKVFELTAASTGMNEKQLKAAKIAYKKTYVHPASHASYYPGASQLSIKLLFADDGKILGAQAVGREGVEKRIDVIASAIHFHGTVYDLEELELCYAPAYSSAKDPVNMAGFTAANILKGDMKVFYAEELKELQKSEVQLIDVSTRDEYLIGTIPEAVNIPLDELRQRTEEISAKKPVYVFCRVGLRGYIASRILMQKGFDVYNLSGGFKTYTMATGKGKETKKQNLDCIGIPKEESVQAAQINQPQAVVSIDACGLQCPGPIMKVSEGMKQLKDGEYLKITATDPAFLSDVEIWCERTGNSLNEKKQSGGEYTAVICKGNASLAKTSQKENGNDKTMVVFSGDLDKAIATFIIANGAAAMGRKVTLFFTFWGLNILRKNEKVKVDKTFIEKMFGRMMPRGSRKLGLSRMNMAGMGAKMIRGIMKKKNVSSLEELIKAAMDSGVRIVACQMSMDVMGIKKEELVKGVEVGGVATFLGSAETSDMNLFI